MIVDLSENEVKLLSALMWHDLTVRGGGWKKHHITLYEKLGNSLTLCNCGKFEPMGLCSLRCKNCNGIHGIEHLMNNKIPRPMIESCLICFDRLCSVKEISEDSEGVSI